MTDVCERRVVHCPNHKASHYLAAFVADHQVDDGTVRIALRRPIRRFAHRRPLIERPVVATLSLQSMNDLYPIYSVTWLPTGNGSSPEFAGTLAVEKCRRDDCFSLILSGQYQPLGAVGATSEGTRGSRIAHVPARDVLRTIADYVTDACAHNEAALAGHSRYGSAVRGFPVRTVPGNTTSVLKRLLPISNRPIGWSGGLPILPDVLALLRVICWDRAVFKDRNGGRNRLRSPLGASDDSWLSLERHGGMDNIPSSASIEGRLLFDVPF